MTHYAAFYCEENVWWLAQEPRFADADVVVITNEHRAVATFAMRAAGALDRCVGWDYHVVLVARGEVWDLDCLAGMPLAVAAWADACFGRTRRLRRVYHPRFRSVRASTYLATFASDRGHMRRRDGSWRHPPPSWPCIGTGSTLPRFLDLDDAELGAFVDVDAFVARYSG